MAWIPTTKNDEQEMLKTIGVPYIESLFQDIPQSLRLKLWKIPEALSEIETYQRLESLSRKNEVNAISFIGGGFYDHYIPAVVDYLSQRGEFSTTYTPYQPECSQGTLQSIYEYQTALCRLTDMEVANASLYDGGTALFEAVMLSVRVTGRRKIHIIPGLNPIYEQMLRTHTANLDLELEYSDDSTNCACIIAATPDFFGNLHDLTDIAQKCHSEGALLIVQFYPISLGLMKTPGEMGADIAVGEGQSLGLPLGFGGPYLGLFAAKKEYIRKMPGRICAITVDKQGQRGFVLTLQTREQHIRREKAMSNVCSNQALCALRALIYLCEVGKKGLTEIAQDCFSKTEYLKQQLSTFVPIINSRPTFNEFIIRLPIPAEKLIQTLKIKGILAGIPLKSLLEHCKTEIPCKDWSGTTYGEDGDLLIAVTEKRTREELDKLVEAIRTSIS
ncbi:MAG TPA: aminomethyl-transferring glycine dehydrogenase subunit GcvPA [Candidatus Hydrogenedens sp.]|nr:aminomethyl-transferring glycine dehydrogenase subunit GcvPA [Candidatus Hydrogenedens sp.]